MQLKRWAPFISGAVIAAAAMAVYANALRGPFLLDDAWNITANPSIRHLWRPWEVLAPPGDLGVGGRPLYNLSFAVNYALGGSDPRGYHALNVLIHALAGLALLGIARRTLHPLKSTWLAPAIAVIWIVHPLLTGSVTYISERSELLMGFFYLLTLYGFVRCAGESRRRWALISIGACLCGAASKEVMVTAPLAVLLYDRLLVAGSFGAALRQRRGYYLGLAASWILLACLMAGSDGRRIGFGHGVGPLTYALTESGVVLRYLGLAFWPHPLVFDYDLPVSRSLAQAWPSALAVLALLGITVRAAVLRPPASRGGRAAAFAAAFFFLALAPTSSFVPVASQPMAENRMYLALAAVVSLAVAAWFLVGGRFRLAAPAIVAVLLGVATIQRNSTYSTGLSIWSDTVLKCPGSARARANLGAALHRAGRRDEAISQVLEAARLEPGNALTHMMLGNMLAEAGREREAAGEYRQALRLDPSLEAARLRLGSLGPGNP